MEPREIFKRKVVLNWVNEVLPQNENKIRDYKLKDFESGNIISN